MKLFPTLVLWTSLSSLFVAAAPAPEPNYDYDSNPHLHHYPKTSLQAISQNYKRYIQDTLNKRSYKDQCNSGTVTVRKEWYEKPHSVNSYFQTLANENQIGVLCLEATARSISKP